MVISLVPLRDRLRVLEKGSFICYVCRSAHEAIHSGARTDQWFRIFASVKGKFICLWSIWCQCKNNLLDEWDCHAQTTSAVSRTRSSAMTSLTTLERCLEEQVRANDLKSMEIGLTFRKLVLKQRELALIYESNNLWFIVSSYGVVSLLFLYLKFRFSMLKVSIFRGKKVWEYLT